MKKYVVLMAMFALTVALSACGAVTTDSVNEVETPVVETPAVVEPVSIPFADLGKDIMDARKEITLFRFTEMEGSCLEMGLPTNLVYKGKNNMIMTEDEKYFDKMTGVDFTGTVRFSKFPLNAGNVNCAIKTAKGINTANMSCKMAEGEDTESEVCTASFKIMAEK